MMAWICRLVLVVALASACGRRALAAAAPADASTIALWCLDEGRGTVAGDALGSNHGQVVGATWVQGRSGQALHFDGRSYVDCGSNAGLNPATALTVEAWFRLSNLDFEGRSWVNLVNKESYASGYCLTVPPAAGGPPVTVRKGLLSKAYLREEGGLLALGNAAVEFVFDKGKGGQLVGLTDRRSKGLALGLTGAPLAGQWELDLEGRPLVSAAATTYLQGTYASDRHGATLEIVSARPDEVRLTQTYALPGAGAYLICTGVLENLTPRPVCLRQYQFSLTNLAIGGSLEGNRYLYPPHVFGFLRGDLAEATPEFMGKRYIYGSLQETGKLMLPYAMIHNDRLGECLAIAAVNPRTVARVGALGGTFGTLTGLFSLYKTLQPGQKEDLGTVYIALHQGDWQQGTLAEKALLMKEAGFGAPPDLPKDLADTVIMSDGIPGVNISTFDDLGDLLKDYREAGITTLHIGGMHFFCPSVLDPKKGVEGFIPVPLNGYATPNPQAGGLEGFKRLVDRAHEQGMRLTVWGPFSMSGISLEAAEATSHPDWWVYGKDGAFALWYPFIAPANPNSPGWRAFLLENVRKVVQDYGVDGFWLDSSWLDHQLNYRAADGWYGEPNGAKTSLMAGIVRLAKSLNPNVLVMAEGGGATYMSMVDAAYTQAFGIWPGISADEVQAFVLAEELNRLPGVRPFGQVCQGTGFFADLQGRPHEMAEKYKDSWMAKTLLVSTLDRVPIYFGLNWGIGYILHAGNLRFPPGSEGNPERLEAERSQREFAVWFDVFKRINRIRAENEEIRAGETRFDVCSVSSPSVVHYLRHRRGRNALILVNAEPEPQEVTVRLTQPEVLGVRSGRRYVVVDLLTGNRIGGAAATRVWSGADLLRDGIGVALGGYAGAVLKIQPEPR